MRAGKNQTVFQDMHHPQKVVVLPLCPASDRIFEMGVYRHFMQNFRQFPAAAAEIRVLSSIQAAAAAAGISPALAAKTLVDIGLRAPRMAFPFSFLTWSADAPPLSVSVLIDHWRRYEGM